MTEKKLSRRDAMKILGAAIGAAALADLPSKWDKPELLSGVLPAHARQSVAAHGTQTFNSSAAFTVPAGITSLTVDAYGAQGGGALGGPGGRTTFTITVIPGETLTVDVGGQGGLPTGGSNGGGAGGLANAGTGPGTGGGGGGWSGVSRGATLLVVAGGGGGYGQPNVNGGAGGGTTGVDGSDGVGGFGGGGGTQAAGGGGGTGGGTAGTTGAAGAGGAGGNAMPFENGSGGGGGGGYYGGGGGGGDTVDGGGGGGGGSSYPAGATHLQGVHSGGGQVILTW
jgi:hypothetical protein